MHRGLTEITAITGALNKVAPSPVTEGRPAVALDDGAGSDHDEPGHGLTEPEKARTLPNHNVVIPVCGSERAR